MTTTKILIEAATLTEEEIHNLLPVELRHFIVAGVPYYPSSKDVATASRDKALWAVVEWLSGLEEHGLQMADVSPEAWIAFGRGHQWPIVEAIEKMLTFAGIERPKE